MPRLSHAHQWKHLITQLQHLVAVHAMQIAFRGARDLRHCVQRNGIQPVLDPEQQRLDDGKGERQLEAEGCALAGLGLDFYRSLQPVQNAAHNVQADAASRKFR